MCLHHSCSPFSSMKCGVIVIVVSNGKVLLGRSRWGKFAGRVGVCKGKMEKKDNNCHIACAVRELNEEFKINISIPEFVKGLAHIELFVGVPVYVYVNNKLNVQKLNEKIKSDYKNLPESELTEMTELTEYKVSELIDPKTAFTIEPIARNSINVILNGAIRTYERKIFYNKTAIEA